MRLLLMEMFYVSRFLKLWGKVEGEFNWSDN